MFVVGSYFNYLVNVERYTAINYGQRNVLQRYRWKKWRIFFQSISFPFLSRNRAIVINIKRKLQDNRRRLTRVIQNLPNVYHLPQIYGRPHTDKLINMLHVGQLSGQCHNRRLAKAAKLHTGDCSTIFSEILLLKGCGAPKKP